LLGRAVSWQVVAALLLGAGLHALLMRRLRLGVLVLVALVAVPLLPIPGAASRAALADNATSLAVSSAAAGASSDKPLTPPELEEALLRFYDFEQARAVRLPDTRRDPPFDLVFLSVCSLAWDDLRASGLDESLLLKRFDLVFRQFNSAASYSGPAVLRLLHAGCGQGPQHTLYEPASERCYLFQRLTDAGWRSALLLNHDGHFDHFADALKMQGGTGLTPVDNRDAPVAMRSFDGTPIYGDYDLLSRWWQRQTQAGKSSGASDGRRAKHVALLYNTISLHDGNRVPGMASNDSLQTWKPRAQKLFSDFDRFFTLVEQSGRPTVVVLVPEHGAGLRGDALQIQGMREYPTPRITNVPAGIALFNMGRRPAGQVPIQMQQATSYTSMLAMVSALLSTDGRTPWDKLGQMARALPAEPWVAENDKTVVMKLGGRLYMRDSEGESSWAEYPSDK
jgi:cellulose synthase operon protein YhjU